MDMSEILSGTANAIFCHLRLEDKLILEAQRLVEKYVDPGTMDRGDVQREFTAFLKDYDNYVASYQLKSEPVHPLLKVTGYYTLLVDPKYRSFFDILVEDRFYVSKPFLEVFQTYLITGLDDPKRRSTDTYQKMVTHLQYALIKGRPNQVDSDRIGNVEEYMLFDNVCAYLHDNYNEEMLYTLIGLFDKEGITFACTIVMDLIIQPKGLASGTVGQHQYITYEMAHRLLQCDLFIGTTKAVINYGYVDYPVISLKDCRYDLLQLMATNDNLVKLISYYIQCGKCTSALVGHCYAGIITKDASSYLGDVTVELELEECSLYTVLDFICDEKYKRHWITSYMAFAFLHNNTNSLEKQCFSRTAKKLLQKLLHPLSDRDFDMSVEYAIRRICDTVSKQTTACDTDDNQGFTYEHCEESTHAVEWFCEYIRSLQSSGEYDMSLNTKAQLDLITDDTHAVQLFPCLSQFAQGSFTKNAVSHT